MRRSELRASAQDLTSPERRQHAGFERASHEAVPLVNYATSLDTLSDLNTVPAWVCGCMAATSNSGAWIVQAIQYHCFSCTNAPPLRPYVMQRKDMDTLHNKFGNVEGLAHELGSDPKHGLQPDAVQKAR